MQAEANKALVRRLVDEAQSNGHLHVVADDEKVVTRKSFEGTHRGEFMGVPATGRRVSFEVIDILTFRDGRISEHRVVFDRLGLQQQLTA